MEFYLLHHFVKRLKTPRREIKAKRELRGLKRKRIKMKNSAIGSNWKDVRLNSLPRKKFLSDMSGYRSELIGG